MSFVSRVFLLYQLIFQKIHLFNKQLRDVINKKKVADLFTEINM